MFPIQVEVAVHKERMTFRKAERISCGGSLSFLYKDGIPEEEVDTMSWSGTAKDVSVVSGDCVMDVFCVGKLLGSVLSWLLVLAAVCVDCLLS
jgi:hypothetical protein